ncbi:hypothetical protein ACFYXC_12950 [Streptomyces sp. NPDC002701]|uniref:hypothetical protein n=1 Tax=Streptomyces sp. NPDC002701 TaxID=3364661 RepID=UPI0036A19F49
MRTDEVFLKGAVREAVDGLSVLRVQHDECACLVQDVVDVALRHSVLKDGAVLGERGRRRRPHSARAGQPPALSERERVQQCQRTVGEPDSDRRERGLVVLRSEPAQFVGVLRAQQFGAGDDPGDHDARGQGVLSAATGERGDLVDERVGKARRADGARRDQAAAYVRPRSFGTCSTVSTVVSSLEPRTVTKSRRGSPPGPDSAVLVPTTTRRPGRSAIRRSTEEAMAAG